MVVDLDAFEREWRAGHGSDLVMDVLAHARALRRHACEWSAHQAWRCSYPQRYPECCCGLHDEEAKLGLPLTPRPNLDTGRDTGRGAAS